MRAAQVLLANGAARHGGYGSFGWLRRRIVPIGSFIVVTEPLRATSAHVRCCRERRTYMTVANIHITFAHARPPPGVRRPRALRGVEPDLGREERRDPANAGMVEMFPRCRMSASTIAGAVWSI